MSADTIFIGCDNLVEWDGAQNEADDSYLNDATATFTLKTLAGVAVVTDVAMSYVTDSDGVYQGTLQSTVSLTENAEYYVEVSLAQSGLVAFRKWKVVAIYKDEA